MFRIILLLVVAAILAACGKGEPNTPLRTGEQRVRQIMAGQIEPNAQIFWHSSGTIYTLKGETSLLPSTEDAWRNTLNSITAVREGGTLLLKSSRGRRRADWKDFSEQLIAKAAEGEAAVRAHDGDKMFNVGGELYSICSACHQTYLLPFLGPDGLPKKIDENGVPIARDPTAK